MIHLVDAHRSYLAEEARHILEPSKRLLGPCPVKILGMCCREYLFYPVVDWRDVETSLSVRLCMASA
jgi:hypothetical protein